MSDASAPSTASPPPRHRRRRGPVADPPDVHDVSGDGDRAGPPDRPDAAAPATTAWQFRVVGHDLVSPGDLITHPDNFKGHPEAQRDSLLAAIDEVGFVGEVLVSRRSGRILDGHLRVAEALRTGQPVVPVGWVDCQSDEDEAAILASHDPIGAMATADKQKLAALTEKADLQAGPLKAALTLMAARKPPPAPSEDPGGRLIGSAFGPQGGGRGGHLGTVRDTVYPVVIECQTEAQAEELLEVLADEGHSVYLLEASVSAVPRETAPWS